MPEKDNIKKICTIMNIENNHIITFEDFIESEFNKPFDEVKDLLEVKMLRKAWNKSCESLLNLLDGISLIAKHLKVNIKKGEEKNG